MLVTDGSNYVSLGYTQVLALGSRSKAQPTAVYAKHRDQQMRKYKQKERIGWNVMLHDSEITQAQNLYLVGSSLSLLIYEDHLCGWGYCGKNASNTVCERRRRKKRGLRRASSTQLVPSGGSQVTGCTLSDDCGGTKGEKQGTGELHLLEIGTA